MAFDDLTKVTVTGHAVTLDGAPATGHVTFTPSATLLQDTTSGQAIFPVPLTAQFSAGAISIDLPVTDQPEIQPQGWIYNVQVVVTGTTSESFQLAVPVGSAPFDLFLSAPIPGSGVVYVPPPIDNAADKWSFLLIMESV